MNFWSDAGLVTAGIESRLSKTITVSAKFDGEFRRRLSELRWRRHHQIRLVGGIKRSSQCRLLAHRVISVPRSYESLSE